MGNGFTGPPAVDFYSMLSGLGDTLQQNAVKKEQGRIAGVRSAAFRDFTALDPNSPEYGTQALTLARRVGAEGDTEGANKFITLAQHAADQARAQKNADRSYGLQERGDRRAAAAEARNAKDYENTPDQYAPNPKAGQPGEPAYVDQYALAKAAAENQAPGGGGLSLTPIFGKKEVPNPNYGQPGEPKTVFNTVLLQPGKSGKAVESELPPGVTLNGYDDATIKSDAARLNGGDDTILRKYDKKGVGRVDLMRLQQASNELRVAHGQEPIDLTQATITMAGDKARERAAGTMEGRMAPASVEAQGAFKIAENAMDNLWRTNSVPLNKLIQMGEKAWSNPELKAAGVALNTAVMTYSRAIAPTGVGTVDSQQHAREILQTADGPKATAAAFAQLAREVDMAHASPGIAREYFAAARKARAQGLPAPQMPEYQPHQPARRTPSEDDINDIKRDPRRAADFDAYFGAGSAERALGSGVTKYLPGGQ